MKSLDEKDRDRLLEMVGLLVDLSGQFLGCQKSLSKISVVVAKAMKTKGSTDLSALIDNRKMLLEVGEDVVKLSKALSSLETVVVERMRVLN